MTHTGSTGDHPEPTYAATPAGDALGEVERRVRALAAPDAADEVTHETRTPPAAPDTGGREALAKWLYQHKSGTWGLDPEVGDPADQDRMDAARHASYEGAAPSTGDSDREALAKVERLCVEAQQRQYPHDPRTAGVSASEVLAVIYAATRRPATVCDGSFRCEAALHVHGCFADSGDAVCDDPDEHDRRPATGDTPPVPVGIVSVGNGQCGRDPRCILPPHLDRDPCEIPATGDTLTDTERERVETIRSRWEGGPVMGYAEATEKQDYEDVHFLLALADRRTGEADLRARIEVATGPMQSAVRQGPDCYQPEGWHALCKRLLAALATDHEEQG